MTEMMRDISVTGSSLAGSVGEEDTSYDLYFGPAHSASGNFGVKLKMDGERVLQARADPGYLHRGFEKLMEYRNGMQNAVLSDRLCVLESLNWNLVHAEAVDELRGIEVPGRAKYLRVLMAELSRIQSHLIWYGALSLGIGFDTGFKLAFGYRDYILDIFEFVTGGRVYPAGYMCPGGVRRDLPEGAKDRITGVLDQMEEMLDNIKKFSNVVFRSRTKGIGILKPEDAIRLGATGPVLRASGIKADVRKDDPYEIYDELDFEVPVMEEGDAFARCVVMEREIEESIKIIRQVLNQMPDGKVREPSLKIKIREKIPEGEVYVRNELARGEGAIYMKSVGGEQPYRCKIRGPDFLHMIPVLEYLLQGVQLADIPAIYWSLNVCPADMDR